MPGFDQCAFLLARWKNFAMWRNLWTILLFLFGCAIIIFLIGGILLFITEAWITGAMSTLGMIVNSVGVKWVLARRSQAAKEESQAKDELLKRCGTAPEAEGGLEAAGPPPVDPADIAAFEQKQKLFGLFR